MRAFTIPLVVCTAVVLSSPVAAVNDEAPPSVASDFVAAGPAERLPSPIAAALGALTPDALGAHITFLASPTLEGRGLGERGLDVAAEYAAASLKLAGIPPLAPDGQAGGASYFQPVPVREISGWNGEVVVERHDADRTVSREFATGADCVFPVMAPGSITAPVVFASHGIQEPTLGRDDFRGVDARGKIVVELAGVPDGEAWQAPELIERYAAKKPGERWAAKLATARREGAVGLLAVDDSALAAKPDDDEDQAEKRYFLSNDAAAAAQPSPIVRVSSVVADALLAGGGPDHASARTALPQPLDGVTATIRLTGTERPFASRNVLGFLVGGDPKLRHDAVVLGAHMDHLGKSGSVVYPGADDNASGVAALIEIARAFAASKHRPRRTVVFAFWTGEEEGKFGSGYFVRHPAWPLGHVAAYLNLDMIGHPWAIDEIKKLVADTGLPDGEGFLAAVKPANFAEAGLPANAPALAEALRRAARATGLALHLDYTEGVNGGSDYRDFARAGVPFIRFFGNFFPAYHEPGDTAEALDFTQVHRIARLALVTAWLLADR